MKYFSPWRSLTAVVPVVAMLLLGTLQTWGATLPYLPAVGPSPLRFEYVASPDPSFLEKLTLPKPRYIPDPPIPGLPDTNMDETRTITSPPPSAVPPSRMGPPYLGSVPGNVSGPANSASDMLNVTPEMINDYFKPKRRDGDNGESGPFQQGENIVVPAELNFVPPMSSQSRAVYRSK